ncbi:MAG: HD domain-containing phosphohydrolase [Thermacetogeniaceae bacterium]
MIEDSDDDARLLIRELQRGNFDPVYERVEVAEEMGDALKKREWDLIISDYVMPRFSGLDALRLMQGRGLDLPFIIVSGYIGEDLAVEAMKLGAHDFILKGNLSRLIPAIRWGLKEAEVRRERRQAKIALERSEQRFRTLFENSPIGINITRGEMILFANQMYLQMYGFKEISEIAGTNELDRVASQYRELAADRMRRRNEGEDLSDIVEVLALRKDGSTFTVQIQNFQICLPDGPAVVGFYTDITERKQTEERLKYLSFHDILTGLYNRSYFEEELIRLDTSRQLPLSIIMGDMDGLKLVNDTLGHQVGDKLLTDAAGILKRVCREDEIICRWGGDEFAVLLPKTDKSTALKICSRIKLACEEIERESVPLSLSLGAATKEHAGQAVEAVLREAEDIMYRDKLLDSRGTRFSMLTFFQRALAEKSSETLEHSKRIQDLASAIGDKLELSSREKDELSILAALHDIGQIGIPGELLVKPCYLTTEEWTLMKKHPEIGEKIARSIPNLNNVAEAILSHHEYWNGTGYPRGLKKEQIPLLSRILAIADAYDVMTNGRPYKKAVSHEQAMKEISKCAGSQFDPELVRLFAETVSD